MRYLTIPIVLILAATVEACASDATTVKNFIDSARAATEKYKDREVAIADGYRQIGNDFPAMGEHWIQTGLLFDGKFDPAQPEMLSYVVVAGKPRLLGVAYLLPLLAGESAPDWPVDHTQWHDHFRTLEDETAMPKHHEFGHSSHGARMTMLHAWLWLDNPAGMFAADNWAVPFARLGIEPVKQAPPAAAKAIALAAGATEYFQATIHASATLTTAEKKKIDTAFTRSRVAVENMLRPESSLDMEKLSTVWTELWREIDSSVSIKARQSLLQNSLR